KIRASEPNAQVWVHPESPFEVTDAADGYGSTTKLIDVVEKAAPGTTLAIGTEWKLVDRLRRRRPELKIVWPGDEPSICVDMSKSTLARAAWVLENWLAGEPVNVVETPETVAASAFEALRVVL
ncbi:MAG: quinolinate synthase NadA, partial [Thermoguttaceae bacterium]|nr:quinolinate synthase NadA [Thermoguttaceae bacterium]